MVLVLVRGERLYCSLAKRSWTSAEVKPVISDMMNYSVIKARAQSLLAIEDDIKMTTGPTS